MVRRLIVGGVMLLLIAGSVPVPAQAATLDELQLSLGQLQILLRSLLGQSTPRVKGASTIVVTSDAELAAAIKGTSGGETIQLAPGTYSTIQIVGGTYNQINIGTTKIAKGTPTLTSAVTITSQNPNNPAVVKSIDVRTSNHWHFKSLAIRPVKSGLPEPGVSMSGSDNAIEDSNLTYGDATNWSAADWLNLSGSGISLNGPDSLVRNNTLKNVYMGIEIGANSAGTLVKNNTVDGIGGDGMRELGDNVTVDSNLFKNFKEINDNHDDCAQSWGMVNGSVSQEGIVKGVIFQNNICINNENPNDPLYDNTQGFDAFDGSMQGWLVQNNVYVSTAYHGLSYSGAVNMVIRNNTIIDSDPVVAGTDTVWINVGSNKTGTILATGNTFQNNIANRFLNYGTSSTVVNSQVVKMADYDKYFRDWRHGDVRLLPSSSIQGVGANLDPATVGSNVTITTPVTTPSPTVTLAPSVTSLSTGGSVTLTWTSTDANSCTAGGDWSGTKTTNGTESITVQTAGTKTYTLVCAGTNGSVTKGVTVSVTDPVVTVPTASTTFTIGDRVSMTKQVNVRRTGLLSTTTLIGTNPAGSLGVLVAGPTVTSDRYGVITWFNVNFDTGFDGWVGADNYALALPSTPTPTPTPTTTIAKPTITFSASPAAALVGTGSTLTWTSTNVTACNAGGGWSGAKTTSGSWSTGVLGSSGTTTYSLTCTGSNGTVVTKMVTVRAVNGTTIASATTTTGVIANATVNVRATPNGTKLGTQLAGTKGILGSQPSVVTAGHTWVYVDFVSGIDGWVSRRYLILPQPLVSTASTSSLTPTEVRGQISSLLDQLAALQQLLAHLKAL